LHTLPATKPPATIGGIARSYLIQAVSLPPKSVDIVFDDYPSPSVKDCERGRRGVDDSQLYVIGGPEQVLLKNFLAEGWHDQSYAHIIVPRDVYVGIRGYCYHYYTL